MRNLMLGGLLAGVAFPGAAVDLEIEPTADQAAFASASEDLLAAFSYKSLQPAEATGLSGFGLGLFGSYMPVDDEGAWERLIGEDVGELGLAGVAAHKGLPLGIDVGVFYALVPTVDDVNLWGAELRWAVWQGGIASPALGLRAAYTAATGADDVDFSSYSVDALVSKGFAYATPYGGIGYVAGSVDPADDIALDKEEPDATRFFVGLRLSTLLFELTPEYERAGDRDAFNLRAGFSF